MKKVELFDADTDEFVLGDRLLTLAIIWQWKAQKGLQYAEDLANYENARKVAIDDDMGASIFAVGTSRVTSNDQFVTPQGYCP
jgi:hypothetical protein